MNPRSRSEERVGATGVQFSARAHSNSGIKINNIKLPSVWTAVCFSERYTATETQHPAAASLSLLVLTTFIICTNGFMCVLRPTVFPVFFSYVLCYFNSKLTGSFSNKTYSLLSRTKQGATRWLTNIPWYCRDDIARTRIR